MQHFSRVELMSIRERAAQMAFHGVAIASWSRAWEALADAADRLDAMMARTGTPEPTDAEMDGILEALGMSKGTG